MITVRTCGSGTSYTDERLQLLRRMVEYTINEASAKIFKLHDHKGHLNVYWFSMPSEWDVEQMDKLWDVLDPDGVSHRVITILQKDLYIRL